MQAKRSHIANKADQNRDQRKYRYGLNYRTKAKIEGAAPGPEGKSGFTKVAEKIKHLTAKDAFEKTIAQGSLVQKKNPVKRAKKTGTDSVNYESRTESNKAKCVDYSPEKEASTEKAKKLTKKEALQKKLKAQECLARMAKEERDMESKKLKLYIERQSEMEKEQEQSKMSEKSRAIVE